jgi:hypothetical protein
VSSTLRLARVPDARRSRWPVFDPAFLPYAALMIGAAPAALLATWNAAGMRRAWPALAALLLGVASWIGFGSIVAVTFAGGLKNAALVVILARLANLGFGLLLAWMQWDHVRGHRFLKGGVVPLLPAVLATLALTLLLPWKVLLVLWGLWQLLV